jgi:hypothetical protein
MTISKEQFSLLMTSATKAGEIEGVKAFIDRLVSNLNEAKNYYDKQRLPIEEKDLPTFEGWKHVEKTPPPKGVELLVSDGTFDISVGHLEDDTWFYGKPTSTHQIEIKSVNFWQYPPKLPNPMEFSSEGEDITPHHSEVIL